MAKQEVNKMRITKERVKELRSQTYGTLQRTEEFKHYLDTYVYNNSKLMNEEVEYILNKSIEDSEAPFSYDDFDQFYYEEDELKEAIIEDIESYEEHEDLLQNLSYINDDLAKNEKTREELLIDLKECLNNSDLEELKEYIEALSLGLYNFEHQTEVMQWFLMDDRLIYQLEQRGEVILNDCYWGRQACGQAIEIDSIIIDIFKEWYLDMMQEV